MTRLAIIGGGIAGRSLLYALAKQKKSYSEIILFDSDIFARTCSIRSTGIVAPRGLSLGHSDLGDLLIKAFETFVTHVKVDQPAGVFPITQFTGAVTKLEEFKKRYPHGTLSQNVHSLPLQNETYLALDQAYLIDPEIYLKWLLDQASALPLNIKNDFVLSVTESSNGVEIITQNGLKETFDSVVFAGGTYNRWWNKLANDQLTSSKPVQGSYLEFKNIDLGTEAFSLTLEGENLVYHAHTKKLLVGSTTVSTHGEVPAVNELREIHQGLQSRLQFKLPAFELGEIKTGIREKASKRAPYLKQQNHCWWIGGYYKNGYSLGLEWANKLITNMDMHD